MSSYVVATRVALAQELDHRFMGRSLLNELFSTSSWIELLFLAIHGSKPGAEYVPLLDDLAVALAAADARIWPLKVGRIIASYGSPLAGAASIVATLEGLEKIGPWVSGSCAEILLAAAQQPANRLAEFVRERKKSRRLFGWGVPIRKQDERFLRLERAVRERGLDSGTFWQLHRRLCDEIREEFELEPNIGSGFAAVLLDSGMRDPKHVSVFMCILTAHLSAAHVIECSREQYEAYKTTPPERIEYEGPAPRSLPDHWKR